VKSKETYGEEAQTWHPPVLLIVPAKPATEISRKMQYLASSGPIDRAGEAGH